MLHEVKVGDKLLVSTGWSGLGRIEVVKSISKTGRITTATGVFDPGSGRMRGSTGFYSTYAKIPTDADYMSIKRDRLLDELGRVNWRKLKTASLEIILSMAKEDDNKF